MAFYYPIGGIGSIPDRLKPTDLSTDVLGIKNNSGLAGVDSFKDVFSSALGSMAANQVDWFNGGLFNYADPKQASGIEEIKNLAAKVLGRVNATQLKAEDLAKDYALGKNVEVHQVIMAAQEASLAFQLTVQIQNKLVEAYQEIMRMQV